MRLFILGLLFISIVGCSSINGSKNLDQRTQVLYKLSAIAETEFDKNGETCADAIGIIEVLHNKILGSASDTFGRRYTVSGTIDDDKKIVGGFAITIITAVDYEGEISLDGNTADGKWGDIYECKGVWKASKIKN